ncbi:Uncharacterised protein [Mycobacteroides abscessus subsp. abscessus]|nr:Uncharacterised protein [Mycobacteroides abscessus subsp. abscessus]
MTFGDFSRRCAIDLAFKSNNATKHSSGACVSSSDFTMSAMATDFPDPISPMITPLRFQP